MFIHFGIDYSVTKIKFSYTQFQKFFVEYTIVGLINDKVFIFIYLFGNVSSLDSIN